MIDADRAWWRGSVIGGAVAWIVAVALLASFARGTAAIPVAEPLRSQFMRDADRIALRIFGVAAAPGVLTLLISAALGRLRRR